MGVHCILLGLLLWPVSLFAEWDEEVDLLLARAEAPDGVVFEIVSGDPDFLFHVLPDVRRAAERLRDRFPGLPLAVVTHGAEQFALMTNKRREFQDVHAAVEAMSRSQEIPVHVCGTHAGWRGVAPEEFPDYVDVAAVGPAQVNDYAALGYVVLLVKDGPL